MYLVEYDYGDAGDGEKEYAHFDTIQEAIANIVDAVVDDWAEDVEADGPGEHQELWDRIVDFGPDGDPFDRFRAALEWTKTTANDKFDKSYKVYGQLSIDEIAGALG